MTNDGERRTYVFSREAVDRAVGIIATRRTHPHLSAYLAVMRARRANADQPAAMSDISQFFDRYLRAEGGPGKMRFVTPFRSKGSGLVPFNANVSGSYAPSSIRPKNQLNDVLFVDGSGQNAAYSLRPRHAQAAFSGLLFERKLPAIALSIFIYRDYGFDLQSRQLSSVINLFRDEFGLRQDVPEEALAFGHLFEDTWPGFSDADLEQLRAGEG